MGTYYIPCHMLKVTYVQNPKCANSSIIHSLNKLEGWFDRSITKHQPMQNKVRPFKIFRRKHEEEFNDYIKFSLVRDPYKRLVSSFVNKVLQPKKVFYGFTPYGITKSTSFLEFCQIIKARPLNKLNDHVRPQSRILPDDLDYVGKVERIEHDWAQLKAKWVKGLPEMGHINKSTGAFYAFPEIEHINKSTVKINPESLLCDDSIKIINEVYKEDFARFNYKVKNLEEMSNG